MLVSKKSCTFAQFLYFVMHMRRLKTSIRTLFLSVLLLAPLRMEAVGWTPTDGGLVLNLEQGDRFLLSVMVGEKEYFVSNYNRYTGGDFNYAAGLYLKLIPQDAGATEPSEMSIWTVGAPLARGKYELDGIVYTIWNDGKTLRMTDNSNFQFLGDLTSDYNHKDAADVVFIVPTDHDGITSFDPNKTLRADRGRTDQNASTGKINGKIGKGFLGMTYREVYMLDIPRSNSPKSYTNASLVTFNTTNKQKTWSNGQIKCDPGHAAYAYADDKHKPTTRTLFRLYMLDEPINYCSSYFFATDEQDFVKYRKVDEPKSAADWTAQKKIYSWDHFTPMTAVNKETSPLYKTGYMNVPVSDSTYYYVGWNNDWRNGSSSTPSEPLGSNTSKSAFKKIRELPMKDLAGFKAPAGAMGRMVVDTTSAADNLGVTFDPAGYFLKVSTGKNVRLRKTGENEWTTQDMWTIDKSWEGHTIRATLMTGPEFSEEDPGVDIAGWSKDTLGSKVPVKGHPGLTPAGQSGYARIYTNRTDANGAMEFILANTTKHIHYDNNGFLGVEIPNQYPLEGATTTIVQAPRLKAGYVFDGWNTSSDGSGDTIRANTVLTLADITWIGDTVFNLYALAHYEGTLQVAISFIHPTDKKRYYLTHPNSQAPRYARARHFEDWENTWQGMENAENLDPNYISTFEMRYPINEINHKECDTLSDLRIREKVLDPRRYVMKGYEDSLIFYEHFAPARDEYLGLYYTNPNTILANNTWAGLFETTSDTTPTGWPDYQVPYIPRTKLKSIRYVEEYDPTKPDSLVLKQRSNSDKPWVHYNESENQFDGAATIGEATEFEISAVIVADAHYIIVPDTSEVWRDTIEFAYHQNEPIAEPVWSKLIGKQLLACMRVGGDTTYFHPNLKKEISDPNNLYLSPDYRVTQIFEFIPDSRVTTVAEEDRVTHETTDHYWHHIITSGLNSPINVTDKSGNYINIVDTFRITLSHGSISKIKEYRGRWKKGAPGLKMNKDGSRYRDVIITTKAYHYGADQVKYVLTPAQNAYSFNPFADQAQRLDFTLSKVTTHQLLDVDNTPLRVDTVSVEDVTTYLAMAPSRCGFAGSHFNVVEAETVGDHVTIETSAQNNTAGDNLDTLVISGLDVEIGGIKYPVEEARVPLKQISLMGDELVWSVLHEGQRYFIMAVGKDGTYSLQFRRFNQSGSTLYRLGDKTQLVRGSNAGDNTDGKYITPWNFSYVDGHPEQIMLNTAYSIGRNLAISGDNAVVTDGAASAFTYHYVNVYTNPNANEEELVKLQYSADKWLKFDGSVLVLVNKEEDASVFSWSYLLDEFCLQNEGAYPSQDRAVFGYNDRTPAVIQTRYKAYREYSTLLNNTITYLCHVEEKNITNLVNSTLAWKTDTAFTLIPDGRAFDGGAVSSRLSRTTDRTTLKTTITPGGLSPLNVQIGGKFVNIVDTLDVAISLQEDAPAYRFKGAWSSFRSIEDAHLKIPLERKTYHYAEFDSLVCIVDNDEISYTFPAASKDATHTFSLFTERRKGRHMLDVDNITIAVPERALSDVTDSMHFDQKAYAEIRLIDEYGNTPSWCKISGKTSHTVTVTCTENGVRSPRSAFLYFAYIVTVETPVKPGEPNKKEMRFVNYRITVSQASHFDHSSNQVLEHSKGASGDEKMANGMQQVHENRRILYYYPEQDTELPIRERSFYGWWRWYRESDDPSIADTDIPDEAWRLPPQNTGKYNYPFRTIGDTVWVDPEDHTKGYNLVTMGRYTVFHYKSKDYNKKADPPAKNPRVVPPATTFERPYPTVTYVADISNYYDNLPMSLKDKNQVDTAMLDTMRQIIEPTLSLREVFELHPWTEMAERMESYKSPVGATYSDESYMEDHVVMAPLHSRLLLQTEQRYNLNNIMKNGFSESLLGYYMRDDNWDRWSAYPERQDTMIWCGGWDAECQWFTYDPDSATYTECKYSITEGDDFLQVPAKDNIDTVYYCLRARSVKTTFPDDSDEDEITEKEVSVDGDYWFNICRYKICYHHPNIYGPKVETVSKKETRALITNDEIEQRYEVLERLNFDYLKPGNDYHIYPHPLPWADASYGYTYPETSALPHNRYHDESDFPNHGEYGLINRIPYSTYWHKMEQHGGASNGYMIYCDGMSHAGQVAALSLHTNLCAGQKMFFSAYVGNPSTQSGKANPNFIFSVQGSTDGSTWDDITSYMTGDIQPSDKWYQIYFPIVHNRAIVGDREEYTYFRVRIYNVSSDWDGNDFIIDDMCIFATKPPLIAYHANTSCKEEGDEKDTHVILRIDYQGITSQESYNGQEVKYTIRRINTSGDTTFVAMKDGYIGQTEYEGESKKIPSVYGELYIPLKEYEPPTDSVFSNVNELLDRFEDTYKIHQEHEADDSKPDTAIYREGYIYEVLEGDIRAVKYVVHSANMNPEDTFSVHISLKEDELLSSICGLTSRLKVSNRMVLELNGLEEPHTEVLGLCANSTYDISLRVKGSLYLDSVAPIDLNGSCINDWLLYGDTVEASSKERYGYYYEDIKQVITQGLRVEPTSGTNKNQFVSNLSSINKNELKYYTKDLTFKQVGLDPYTMISDLVNNGFLTLYKSKTTATVSTGDSVQYIIMPIVGTGTDALNKANIEVCPSPIFVKLKSDRGGGVPLMIGGLHRDSTEMSKPVEVLASERMANSEFKVRIDSIMPAVGIHTISLRSTDDPEFREGIHTLDLVPDIDYPTTGTYYVKGDSMILTPALNNNYTMRQGYHYTFDILMQTYAGLDTLDGGCAVGTIPFMLSVMPDYLRWDPQSSHSNEWNNPDNWIGITQLNVPIQVDARFAPMAGTNVLIPQMTDGLPYPIVPPMPATWRDSVQKVNFEYNNCNIIRFLPGAAMSQQQRMNYADAVIDMAMPQQKWAFRSSPVTGMLSGDIYMSDADLNGATSPWEVGSFDASGRTYKTGNGSFWLSVYSRTTIREVEDEDAKETRTATADWSKVTNGLNLYLPSASGWAVYARTASGKDAVVRLPKNDDRYYYYDSYGQPMYDRYVQNLRTMRNDSAGGTAGKLAFHEESKEYTIRKDNNVSTEYFVFGNPTMGYIDIWGFIDDNCLVEEIGYLDEKSGEASIYLTRDRATAMATKDTISEQQRYLPPLHAMMVRKSSAATSLPVTLNAYRVVTDPSQVKSSSRSCGGGSPAPKRQETVSLRKGIMTITAINPASPRCTSYLLLGQGYHADLRSGEDALLTTLNIDNFSTTNTPTTPFNIYAVEGGSALSIDLLDEIQCVPVSFFMSDLEYEPITNLWFTGVNNIDGQLVFYDALTDSERPIIDGICITIETPTLNHERRYFIRRPGYNPDNDPSNPTTGFEEMDTYEEHAYKMIHEGQVYILRNGHVYTIMGQKVK